MVTTIIAVLALVVSILALGVNYRNQLERRHGEITQLRSILLKRISDIRHRLTSSLIHLETAKMQIRSLPDSEDKYELIEEMPSRIEEMEKHLSGVSKIENILKNLDTVRFNKTKLLMDLRDVEAISILLEDNTDDIEVHLLNFLETIRKKKEEALTLEEDNT